MAKQLSKNNIIDGNIIEDTDITQLIDALAGIDAYDVSISGSLKIEGPTTNEGISTVTSAISPYTTKGADYMIVIDASSSTVDVILPSPANYKGKQLFFKVLDASNAITLSTATPTDSIDGALVYNGLNTQYDAISLISDGGSNWYIF